MNQPGRSRSNNWGAVLLLIQAGLDNLGKLPRHFWVAARAARLSKYTPSNGDRECARRVRQMERLATMEARESRSAVLKAIKIFRRNGRQRWHLVGLFRWCFYRSRATRGEWIAQVHASLLHDLAQPETPRERWKRDHRLERIRAKDPNDSRLTARHSFGEMGIFTGFKFILTAPAK